MKNLALLIVVSFLTTGSLMSQNKDLKDANNSSRWNLPYDKNYKLKFFGRISVDGAIFTKEDYQKIGNGTTISQLAIGGIFSFGDRLEGKLEVDFSNGGVVLLDNFITYNFTKKLGIRAGNIQEAFSMDLLNSFKDLSLMNRAQVVNAFAPGHHLGIQGVYESQQWLITSGLHFQRSMVISQKENYESNYKKGQNEGLSSTSRVVWMPQNKHENKGLHLGISGSYRTPKADIGKDTEPNTIRYSASESTINKIRFLDTGFINNVDYNLLAGIEFAGYYGPFKFQTEYIHNRVKRKNGMRNDIFSGFYVQSSCLLLGGKQDYNNSRGAFNQPLVNNKGDLELAVRFDHIDMNSKNVSGGLSNQYTLGTNYYINENLKLQFNYSIITHDKLANANGTAAIGYNSEGKPVSQIKDVDYTKGKPRNNYNSLNFRVQLRF